jgi:hypothetical protein
MTAGLYRRMKIASPARPGFERRERRVVQAPEPDGLVAALAQVEAIAVRGAARAVGIEVVDAPAGRVPVEEQEAAQAQLPQDRVCVVDVGSEAHRASAHWSVLLPRWLFLLT